MNYSPLTTIIILAFAIGFIALLRWVEAQDKSDRKQRKDAAVK